MEVQSDPGVSVLCPGLQHPDSPAGLHLQRGVRVHLLQRGQTGSADQPVGLPQLFHYLRHAGHGPQLLQVIQPPPPLEHRGPGKSQMHKCSL